MKTAKNKVYFSKIKEKAIIPSKKLEDAGYDFYACFDEDYILFKPFETKLVPTGIAWASGKEFYLQIEERSSTGSKGLKKSAGVIDSGYRGEIKVVLYNANNKDLILSNLSEEELIEKYKIDLNKCVYISAKKAICQGIIHKIQNLNVEELSYQDLLKISSDRGVGGFGSSKK